MELRERVDAFDKANRDFDRAMHGIPPAGTAEDPAISGQPMVGSDPTQGSGTSAWQRALRMGMQANARQRRN